MNIIPETLSILSESILSEHQGLRLDQWMALQYPQFSRARLQAWIRQGCVTISDCVETKPKRRLRAGEAVVFVQPDPVSQSLDSNNMMRPQAESMPLAVVFEDEHLMVVDKPAGLVVHPAPGHASGTLVNALIGRHSKLAHLPRAGVVHRIDKDTTGLLLVAKTLEAHTALVRQLAAREIQREYRALVIGDVISGGEVDAPIGRHSQNRFKMAVVEGGRVAVTHYRVLEKFGQLTQLSVRLETGRTHQIRVHMAHRGFPLFGDQMYGRLGWQPRDVSAEARVVLQAFKRQALHAMSLGLQHPCIEAEWLQFEAPLPADYEALVKALKKP